MERIKSFFKILKGTLFIFIALCILNFFMVTAFEVDIRPVTLLQAAIGKKGMLILGVIYSFIFCER